MPHQASAGNRMNSRRTVTFPKAQGLWRGCLVLIVVFAGLLFLAGVSGCVFPPGAAVDGYASARVETWRDADGDGERDADESPLPWVTIQMAYARSITDSSGRGTVGIFKPGCARWCWQDEAISVMVPSGYRATTPTEVELTGAEDGYVFGFRMDGAAEPFALAGVPDWAHAFLNRGLDLVDLGYDVGDQRLVLTFDTSDSPDQNAFYGDVFDVARSLQEVVGISVVQIEIISLPSGSVGVCDLSQVETWMGKLPPAEVVSTYCRSP